MQLQGGNAYRAAMSFVSPTIGRAGRAARPVFRLRSRQSRHLNSDARSLPIDPPVRRRIPPGRKAAVYVASAALITVGWLAWDASAYAKTARKQTPDILLSSMSTGDVIKSYLSVYTRGSVTPTGVMSKAGR